MYTAWGEFKCSGRVVEPFAQTPHPTCKDVKCENNLVCDPRTVKCVECVLPNHCKGGKICQNNACVQRGAASKDAANNKMQETLNNVQGSGNFLSACKNCEYNDKNNMLSKCICNDRPAPSFTVPQGCAVNWNDPQRKFYCA